MKRLCSLKPHFIVPKYPKIPTSVFLNTLQCSKFLKETHKAFQILYNNPHHKPVHDNTEILKRSSKTPLDVFSWSGRWVARFIWLIKGRGTFQLIRITLGNAATNRRVDTCGVTQRYPLFMVAIPPEPQNCQR